MEAHGLGLGSPLSNPLGWASLTLAVGAAVILVWYLWARPPLVASTKLALLIGVAILPAGSALSGNLLGFQTTTERQFCGSCHVMEPYTDDASDPNSETLAAIHGRNAWFGHVNCYTCHSNYEMFGTVHTKIGGMKHVYAYYGGHNKTPITEFLEVVEIYKPFPNHNCMQCHSTTAPRFNAVEDHVGSMEEVRAGTMSCASDGCHGPAHPFSKEAKRRKREALGLEPEVKP